jgi:hypothetical protein
MDEFKMTIENHELGPLLRSFFPAAVSLSMGSVDKTQIYIWLGEHFGQSGIERMRSGKYEIYPRRKWAKSLWFREFRFRDPNDAMLFKMRWG